MCFFLSSSCIETPYLILVCSCMFIYLILLRNPIIQGWLANGVLELFSFCVNSTKDSNGSTLNEGQETY